MAQRTCSINDCDKTTQGASICSMHRARIARHGSPDVKLRDNTARTVTGHGYVVIRRLGHPLAPAGGRGLVYEHRVVLYEAIGAGSHECHWCRVLVSWGDDLVVDHLDAVRSNNDPANLVPACQPCNAARRAEVGGRRARAASTSGAQ